MPNSVATSKARGPEKRQHGQKYQQQGLDSHEACLASVEHDFLSVVGSQPKRMIEPTFATKHCNAFLTLMHKLSFGKRGCANASNGRRLIVCADKVRALMHSTRVYSARSAL